MATTFTGSDDLRGAEFRDANLRHARFIGADLTAVVMRGVDIDRAEIDAPWLLSDQGSLLVNGVDVAPYVDAELDRRYLGRADRRAADPESLRAAWASLERAWAGVLERVETMPEGTVDVSVGGEWSFAQTLRHLVHATDVWLGKGIQEGEQPFHPLGLSHDASPDATDFPSYNDVLAARAGHVAMVRNFLGSVTAEELAAERRNPHEPDRPETVLSCLHVILEEEWEHQRYAVRDLDTIESNSPSVTRAPYHLADDHGA